MKYVGVFLSSAPTVSPQLMEEAETLGQALGRAGLGVVFGGSNAGCMGRLADGVLRERGPLIGVVPEMDFMEDIVQPGLTEKVVVKSMAERKQRMIERANAFIAFPGGIGTLDEIMDVLALRQIGATPKPIVFYNYLSYWTPFVECLENFYQQRTITSPLEDLFVVLDGPSNVVNYLETCFRN